MRYDLADYQRDAAVEVLRRLRTARRNWHEDGERSSFALSAITGSGKTVIATAVIEALLHGSADLQVERDPTATFLWITDDPALNRQTINRMLEASDLLQLRQLVEVDAGFLDSELAAGRTYFLNIQKLSRGSTLDQAGTNLRQHSMWEVVANTVRSQSTDLYVVLDEAHRGMRRARDRTTIVRRIIDGVAGEHPAVPVVWGISATIERFSEAMGRSTLHNSLRPVEVDVARVRASGLVKDQIGLVQPAESGSYGSTLLREAVASIVDYDRRWRAHTDAEATAPVEPVLVVQVVDKVSDDSLAETLAVITDGWRDLGPDAVAHVFGDHTTRLLAGRRVPYIAPESIQGSTHVRVVFAKEAISTGWDCPRAEVLYSDRAAVDATHIAQVVGRMVRQPLARRILTDDALNSVRCFLPRFDRAALGAIKDELEGRGASGREVETGPDVSVAPAVFDRNRLLDDDLWQVVATLPSIPAPAPGASPLRRAKALARLLTDTADGSALLPDAGDDLTTKLNARLDGLAVELATAVADSERDLREVDVSRTAINITGDTEGSDRSVSATHLADLDRDSRRVVRSIREGVGTDYVAHRCRREGADILDERVAAAALLRTEGVLDRLDAAATEWVRAQLTTFAVEIAQTAGATREGYRRVEVMTSDPEVVGIDLRTNVSAATAAADGSPLPRYRHHLYCDGDGAFPAALNRWERRVLLAELDQPSFVTWYRNPSRSIPSALRIAYLDDAGAWRSLQPDLLVLSRRRDGSLGASIVDPHGDHLADARAKVNALTSYAEQYGDRYVRIESIAEGTDGTLRVLDHLDPRVRTAVRAFDGARITSLYDVAVARDFRDG